MAARAKGPAVDRRNFLKGAVVGAATLATNADAAPAQPVATRASLAVPPICSAAEIEPPSDVEVLAPSERPGADFMVDVLKSLGFDYLCANPGTSFRGLHESIINYGGNQNPEFITCCHEESSVAMAHGYFKIEGKPLCVCAHGTVGLQHASMAIYNAWCDRVPIYIVLGNMIDATKRHSYGDWDHAVQDAAATVRDFVKWDDLPISLPHFAESAVRAYKVAMTPPMEPVVLVVDQELAENPIPTGTKLNIPKLTLAVPPQGDSGAVAEAARLLVEAENPVIALGRAARTQQGVDRLVELAELLQAPVIDKTLRMNFPTRHPLSQSVGAQPGRHGRQLIAQADVILGLEVNDFWDVVNSFSEQQNGTWRRTAKPDAKLISINTEDLYSKSNYQDFQRYTEIDVDIAADVEATLPSLIDAIKRRMTAARSRTFQERGAKLATAHDQELELTRTEAAYGWDDTPISVARLCAELWEQIKNEDWSFVSYCSYLSWWPLRLFDFKKHYQYIGESGGYGIGYNAPATLGAALANRKYGRLTVNTQSDGDLMYAPGILWTAAHHRIPILNIMHNNRAYHQELMYIQRMCNRHNRGIDRAKIGTTLQDPNIDFAKMAQSMGVYAEGPITDPKDLGPAMKRAIEVVKRGEPALVDVVTQAR
jgi:thiamine pyrophosphate-dependent acetolactate synthase large subunit-like protein